jgi:rhodanese-related sulfurtransferase
MGAPRLAARRPPRECDDGEVPVIEADELRRMLERRVPVQVLDVRPAEERGEWFIPGSVHRDACAALKAGDESALDGLPLTLAEPVDQARARAGQLHDSLRMLLALDPELLVLPAHTSRPIPFDGVPVGATLRQVREAVHVPACREAFVEHVLGRIPPTPPNHHAIVGFNEAGELPAGDPTDLEAGANRCANG